MATDATGGDAPDAYDELLDRYGRIADLSKAGGVLGWDQQVTMPEGGTPARARQLSTIQSLAHEQLTDDRIGELLDDLDGADLSDEQAAVVREIRRSYDRQTSVPGEVVEELASATSEAQDVWEQARADDDWDAFAPTLERLVELRREYAAAIDPDRDPYEVLFEEYEPYLDLDTAERVLGRVRDHLVDLIADIDEEGATMPDPVEGTFPADDQEAVSREVLEALGYDFEHGRLDVSAHPFTSGNQYDARVTTRFDESEPVGSLLSTVHEFGHACYVLGLPREAYGTPLGEDRDMTVHESQSRLWENHVARSRPFWEFFLPIAREHYPAFEDVTAEEMYRAVNRIYPDNLIRVEADELTYHLHIALRFEIERDLVRGDLDVADVPQVWNDKMESYLGVRPDTDADGALQDIHWSQANYGYFPTYSLGSILAAQLDAAMREDLGDVDEQVRQGDFDAIREWLREHVHRHGCRYTTDDLVREATGEAFTADYFLDYADRKFRDLYGL